MQRLQLGVGPSSLDARGAAALTSPVIGQFDPAFTAVMDEVADRARQVFQTANRRTLAISGTRLAGLEALLCSVLEPGERVVVGGTGVFGGLARDSLARRQAEVEVVPVEWGSVLEPDALGASLRSRPTRLALVMHVDPTTGVVQRLDELARVCRANDTLLVVDASYGFAGCELATDAWAIDAVIGGSEYCLGGPAGITPLSYGARVETALLDRRTPPISNFLDLQQVQAYWSPERLNHHTAPTSLVYGLSAALAGALAEGLRPRWERHARAGAALRAGLEALRLQLWTAGEHAAPMIVLASVPESVAEGVVRQQLRDEFGIVVSPGQGHLLGRVWRFGLLGANANLPCVLLLLAALEQALASQGWRSTPGAARAAALAVWPT